MKYDLYQGRTIRQVLQNEEWTWHFARVAVFAFLACVMAGEAFGQTFNTVPSYGAMVTSTGMVSAGVFVINEPRREDDRWRQEAEAYKYRAMACESNAGGYSFVMLCLAFLWGALSVAWIFIAAAWYKIIKARK